MARWLPRIAALVAVALFGVLTALHSGNSRGWTAFSDGSELLAACLATLACAIRAARERRGCAVAAQAQAHEPGDLSGGGLQRHAQVAWTLLTAGAAAWACGEVVTCIYQVALQIRIPEPSAADAGYLLGYCLIVCGLLAFVRTPAGLLSQVRGAVEGLFIACGFVLFSWSIVIGPVLAQRGALTFGGAVNLAYPVLDAVALAGVFFVALQRTRDRPAGLGVLALGIVLLAVSDSSWWYLSEVQSGLPSVTPVETGWVAGFLLVAIAALCSRARPPRTHAATRRGWTLALPSLPTLAGVLIVLADWLVRGSVVSGTMLLAIALAVVLLGVALLVIASYENHALTSHLEQRVDERTAELERRTGELAQTERYYRALVQNSSDLVIVVDADLKMRYVSDSSRTVFGYPPEDLTGRSVSVFGEAAAATLGEALGRVGLDPGHVRRVEWELTDAAGRTRRAESTITNLVADPSVAGFVLNTRDDTDRAALADQLRNQAFHDPLTGLPNRALLDDRVSQAFARSERTATCVAIMVIDIDAFKLINDGFGHEVGDLLLSAIAQRLLSSARPQDTVARLGGDEFVVLMDPAPPPAPDATSALALAERLRDALLGEFTIEGTAHHITPSIGVALGATADTNFSQLLSDADVALYAVKGAGRNGVQLFQSSVHHDARERFKLQGELRTAIDAEEFCLFYQPEFDAGGERLDGFEALIRWKHPERGLLAPGAFIPLAEETGLIVPLGRWVLGEAMRQAVLWSHAHEGARALNMSVNVSSVQLKTPTIVADVAAALQASKIDPAHVVLEVTESSFIDSSEATVNTLSALKQLGVRLALDDFGTGYASISNLESMPIDILKVDKSFVRSHEEGGKSDLLEAILNIGRVLSLVTIVEGIEEPAQLAAVEELGCDLTQGYLLGRPVPAEEAELMILDGAGARTAPEQGPVELASTGRARGRGSRA
jgi:diguanylate cyclase (GGDEF)-like protein/PAS domain S-box-containing protein